MPRPPLSDAERKVLKGRHARGGPHKTGKPSRGGEVREVRFLLCPACGRTGGDFGTLHRLTVRVRRTAGYKRLSWHDADMNASERVRLVAQLRRALAALESEG